MGSTGSKRHDEAACSDTIIGKAEAHCAANKLRFTRTRRRVLEILLEGHKALGAYDILQRLADESLATQPVVAYRALAFLVTHGFAHKVERLNGYIACGHPFEAHGPAFMICRVCDSVTEVTSSPSRGILGKAAREAGFRIEKTVVEAEGVCPDCAAAGAAA